MSQQGLMVIGVASVALLAVGLVYFAAKFFGAKKPQEKALSPENPAVALRSKYDGVFAGLNVPVNAMTVGLAYNNYLPDGGMFKHYCWVDSEGMLTLFPHWDGFAAIDKPDASLSVPGAWRIPVGDVVFFASGTGFPCKFVVLQYKKDGEAVTVAFSDDAARVFAALLPDKDFSNLFDDLYPKSSRNIQDIKENLASLKEMLEEGLITEEEYSAKKKELLISM